jgi:two-component system phosphate regulon sensor histidine kinase PhoR
MLTRASRWRDWGQFVVVASLPALAIGAVALRAVRNEEAAVQEAARLELEGAASRLAQRYTETVTALEVSGVLSPPLLAAAPYVEVVTLARDPSDSTDGDDKARRERAAASASCRELAKDLARGGPTRRDVRQRIVRECAHARGDSGRHLWPLAALGDAEGGADGETIASWIADHRRAMSTAERAVTAQELRSASWLDGALRERLARELEAPSNDDAQSLARARRRAMALGAPRIVWSEAGSRGALVRSSDGGYRGFVIHPGSLARALESGWPADLPEGAGIRLSLRQPDGGEPQVEVLPRGAYLTLAWTDPGVPAARAARARLVLLMAAGLTALAAVGLAALLFQRMRAARQLSSLRTDFVAAVSHELRTPIASIRMLAELLADDRIEPEERGQAQKALAREAQRVSQTVHQLLNFSRMEGGKLRAERRRMQVGEVVSQAIDVFEERHPDMPPVVRAIDNELEAAIDPDGLRLALDNLLANARRHAPTGAPYEVELDASAGGVRIQVRDHGDGVARRDRERIFQPFERAADKLSEATEGSGIGLSLVRHVARAHGGRAYVESPPGGGASFVILLPGDEP